MLFTFGNAIEIENANFGTFLAQKFKQIFLCFLTYCQEKVDEINEGLGLFVMSIKGYYTNPNVMVWYFVNDFYKVFMMTIHCHVIFKFFVVNIFLQFHWYLNVIET